MLFGRLNLLQWVTSRATARLPPRASASTAAKRAIPRLTAQTSTSLSAATVMLGAIPARSANSPGTVRSPTSCCLYTPNTRLTKCLPDSRVTCINCGEKGHTKVRCKEPPKAEETDGAANGNGGYDNGGGGGFDNENGGGWDNNASGFDTGGGDGGGWNATGGESTPVNW